LREQDRAEGAVVVRVDLAAGDLPIREPERRGPTRDYLLRAHPRSCRRAAEIADEGEVADELPRTNVLVRHRAEFRASAVAHRKRDRVAVATWRGGEAKLGAIARQGDGFLAARVAHEQRAASTDAGVEPSPEDQAVAKVAQRPLRADAKTDRPRRRQHAAADSSHAHRHIQGAVAFIQLPGEDVDVAVGRRVDALDAAVGDPPVLQRVRPIFRAEPHAVVAGVPAAAEFRCALRLRPEQRRDDGGGGEGGGGGDEAAAGQFGFRHGAGESGASRGVLQSERIQDT
jgi:hypothetical protein